jgi:hypothetical protein
MNRFVVPETSTIFDRPQVEIQRNLQKFKQVVDAEAKKVHDLRKQTDIEEVDCEAVMRSIFSAIETLSLKPADEHLLTVPFNLYNSDGRLKQGQELPSLQPVNGRIVGLIYKLYDKYTGHLYIGSTLKDLSVRYAFHIRDARRGSTMRVHKYMRMFGCDRMIIQPVELVFFQHLDTVERWYIKTCHPELNTKDRIENIGDVGDEMRLKRVADIGKDNPPIVERYCEMIALKKIPELDVDDGGYMSHFHLSTMGPDGIKAAHREAAH